MSTVIDVILAVASLVAGVGAIVLILGLCVVLSIDGHDTDRAARDCLNRDEEDLPHA